MTGLLGGGLVTGACFWLGWRRRCWYRERRETLSRLCGDLARMEAELRERETETAALLTLLAQGTGRPAAFYRRCLDEWTDETECSLSVCWERALEQSRLPLRGEEAALWNRAGQVLGRYTGAEQARLLAGLGRELELCRQTAREEERQRGKTAVVLGTVLGLALTLLLL